MSDEPKMRQDAARGERAKALVEDPLLAEAFERLEGKYVAAWRNSRPEEGETREYLFHCVGVLADVRAHLNQMIQSGKLAREELKRRERNRSDPPVQR